MILCILWQGIRRWFSWTDNLERHGCPFFLNKGYVCMCNHDLWSHNEASLNHRTVWSHAMIYDIHIPLKTDNISLENWWLEDESSFSSGPFFRVHSFIFRGGIISSDLLCRVDAKQFTWLRQLSYTITIINYLGFYGLMVRSCRFEFVYIIL